MKIGVPVKNRKGMDSELNDQFGRSPIFAIYDTNSGEIEFVDNMDSATSDHGAGISTARVLLSKGVNVVVGWHIGPKSKDVLTAGGVKIYEQHVNTLREAVELVK